MLLSNYFFGKFLEMVSIKDMPLSLRILGFFDRVIQEGRVQVKTTIFVFMFKKFLGLLLQSFSLSRCFESVGNFRKNESKAFENNRDVLKKVAALDSPKILFAQGNLLRI